MQKAQQRSLTKEQKEAVGILSIGTFFEQFDIMLYIHMSVLLNELFFPQTDQNVASLLSAFTFCSTFIFIPIGALIFGWVGDNIGRKSTVVLTTLLTALSCLTIAFLPTYAEIGIKASIIMIGCRILQSIASMGEVIGALVYITEFTKPPIRYYAVALIPVLGYSGGLAALGIASLIVYAEVNWRGIFVFGALIALVGIAIRTKLSETKDFVNTSKRLQTQYNVNPDEEDLFYDESYKKTSFAMFCTQCAWPLCFYFVFIYCSQMLKSQFEYSVLDIIKHNFVISIFPVVSCFIRAKLSKRLHPLILFKYSLIISFFFFIIIAFYLDSSPNPLGIGIFQSLLLMFTPNGYSESSVIFPHFPVFKRFQSACLSYAFSRAFMYIATSFGLILIIKLIGISWGLIFATSCVSAIGAYGCFYFLRLEQKNIMI